uniref:Variable lymphocyte receptor A cassette n=2 Tax=Petromyzon marinus TaxID=7757 RepID=S4S1C8_PETMA
ILMELHLQTNQLMSLQSRVFDCLTELNRLPMTTHT